MRLPLQIAFRHMEPAPAIEAIVKKRAAGLDRFADDIMGCRIVIKPAAGHHKHGNPYEVRVDVTLSGGEVVVTREPSARTEVKDIRVAIRNALDSACRQIEDFVRRRRGQVKTLTRSPVARVSKLFPEAGYGFLETADGREIYFHRHSVTGDRFDRLDIGSKVTFVEKAGEKGPQASTVKSMPRGRRV